MQNFQTLIILSGRKTKSKFLAQPVMFCNFSKNSTKIHQNMPDSNISGKDTSSQIQSDRVKLQLIFLNANTGVIVCRFRIAYGFSVAKAA